MEEFKLDESSLVITSSGSKGSQLKYKQGGKWFKVNTNGYEAVAEVLACCILKASNYKDFVVYHQCIVNGRRGCYSEDFLRDGEQLVTFENLYYLNTGESLTEKITHLPNVADRIDFTKEWISKFASISVDEYVDACIALDYLIRNGDRHLNNMAVVRGSDGYRLAPIFDNGDAFFSDYGKFEPWCSLDECYSKSTAKPFSGSFIMQYSCISDRLGVNVTQAKKLVEEQPDSRGKQAALYLLSKVARPVKAF